MPGALGALETHIWDMCRPDATNQKSAPGPMTACALPNGLLGVRGLLPGLLDRDQIDLATGSFDSRSSTLGRVVNLEGHLLGRKTFRTDQAHAVLRTADHTGAYQGSGINDTLGIELATVDIGLDAIDADFIEILRIPGIEAALGHTHVKGHLAAFKSV